MVTETLLQAGEVDAVMVLHAPISGVSSTKAAEAVAQATRETRGAVLTSWMGGQRVAEGRHLHGLGQSVCRLAEGPAASGLALCLATLT